MADVTLPSGRKLTLDIYRVSMREYRAMVALYGKPELLAEEDKLVSRAFGLTVDEYLELPPPVVFRLGQEFYKAAREPLADPNSVSASTSA